MKKLPNHFFVSSSDGGLYDTRVPNWHNLPPLRAIHTRHYQQIKNTLELRAVLRSGGFAWPGGYPLYFICADGAALNFKTVLANYKEVSRAVKSRCADEWQVVAIAINYEDNELTDAHTGKPIEAAYHN